MGGGGGGQCGLCTENYYCGLSDAKQVWFGLTGTQKQKCTVYIFHIQLEIFYTKC